MRFAKGLIVRGVGDEDDLRARLAPAGQLMRHRNGKLPVFLCMDN
jgi:hypothetical protein